MIRLVLLLVALQYLDVALAQVPFLGKCPDIPAMKHFQPDKYLGKWFEAARYFAVFEFGGKCVTAQYALNNKGEFLIINRQTSALTGMPSMIEGLGNLIDSSDEAKLSVQFPSLAVNIAAPYWVLDSDYDNYSVVWSCYNFGIFSTRNVWILTRMRSPSSETIKKAYKIIDSYGISRNYFIKTDQKNCPIQY